MKAYRTCTTVDKPKQIVLEKVPFSVGEKVEVLVRPYRDKSSSLISELKASFKETQQLPQIEKLTHEEIAQEISSYRHDS